MGLSQSSIELNVQNAHRDAHKLRWTHNFTVRNRFTRNELRRMQRCGYVYGIFDI
jgi:hypothetical protein